MATNTKKVVTRVSDEDNAGAGNDTVDVKILKVLMKWRVWDRTEITKEELATELGYKSTKTKAFDVSIRCVEMRGK